VDQRVLDYGKKKKKKKKENENEIFEILTNLLV
jgi:hypothetical protein